MAIAERSDDPRWLLLEVYGDHQPATRADILFLEALAMRSIIGLTVVWRCDRFEHLVQMWGEFGMTVRGDDVLRPGVFEQDHAHTIGCSDLASDRPLSTGRI